MKRIPRFVISFLLLAAVVTPGAAPSENAQLTDLWDELLQRHVAPGRIGEVELTVVDYQAIAQDPDWERLVDALAEADVPRALNHQKAFWLNAYNILAIKVVLSEYPIGGIKEAGGWIFPVWNIDAGEVAGETYSLGHIEHDILRSMGDPLVHAGIVCASVSCPNLRRQAYRGEKVDKQLEEQMREFLANPHKGARLEGNRLHVSYIFDLFTKDFTRGDRTLIGFLKQYLPEDIRDRVDERTKIRFMDYDWSLNDAKRAETIVAGK